MTPTPALALAAMAVAGALCALVLRGSTPELALILSLVTGALLIWKSWSALVTVIDLMDELAAQAGLDSALLTPVLRTVGISILVHLSAQLCRDAGCGGIAGAVELAGALAALAAVSPLIRGVMELVGSLL